MEKMAKAINFEFTSYVFEPDKKQAIFCYKTEFKDKEPTIWTETIILPQIPDIKNIPQEIINKLLQSLHIILGISYYKFYCSPSVALAKEGATLSKKEANFWNTIYKKGLGEFFYRNNLGPKISPKFPHSNKIEKVTEKNHSHILENKRILNKGYLVGVSGGKDSIVGAELLKQSNENITAFYVATNKESQLVNNVIKLTGLPQLKIQRILDEKVFQKHQYNGHIPISAIYAFLGIFASVLYDYKGFVVSNEYSSNFGNTKYKGLEINHQWSKTFEFEKMFSDYIKEFISPDLEYFSILRPFYEIRIAEMFARYPKYFSSFSSCNSNFKLVPRSPKGEVRWCGKCAKCVFVFILLSTFLPKKELLKIFNKNLYQDQSLLPLFKDVLGLGNLKPFDCVGTFEEARTAFKIASKKYKADFIVRHLSRRTKIYSEVFKAQNENLVPEQFKFSGMKNVLILGYGKEGQATKKYLQKFYPKLKISIADEKQGQNYLAKQNPSASLRAGFDIAIKTPGINKKLVKIPYTTATNIFFSEIRKTNSQIIGVTGSKGKSTTASLIFEILKTAGKNVELLGNIGKPMLEYLVENDKSSTKNFVLNKIFVLELSSYQLDDIKFSPDIAVVKSLFPEHMDFHGNLQNYYNAKKNIINFQNKNNYFVYNPRNKTMKSWLKNYKGKAIPFSESDLKSNLLGQHNKSNIDSAVKTAEILGISDSAIIKAVKNFKGLAHRLEFVGQFKGIKFYDDAISTTPESTIMAIKALPEIAEVSTIFLGGQDRGYNFSKLAKIIKKYKIKNIVLFPDSGKKIKKALMQSQGFKNFNFFETKSMKRAVEFAYKFTRKGAICLLSCASPSYSLWKNFEQKGSQFKQSIIQLSKK